MGLQLKAATAGSVGSAAITVLNADGGVAISTPFTYNKYLASFTRLLLESSVGPTGYCKLGNNGEANHPDGAVGIVSTALAAGWDWKTCQEAIGTLSNKIVAKDGRTMTWDWTIVFTFAVGAIRGAIRELGVDFEAKKYVTQTNTRLVLVPEEEVFVEAEQQIIVTYNFHQTLVLPEPSTFQVLIDGVLKDFTSTAKFATMYVDAFDNIETFGSKSVRHSPDPIVFGTSPTMFNSSGSQPPVVITNDPVTGIRTTMVTVGTTNANYPTGIKSIFQNDGYYAYGYEFDPAIPKTEEHKLEFDFIADYSSFVAGIKFEPPAIVPVAPELKFTYLPLNSDLDSIGGTGVVVGGEDTANYVTAQGLRMRATDALLIKLPPEHPNTGYGYIGFDFTISPHFDLPASYYSGRHAMLGITPDLEFQLSSDSGTNISYSRIVRSKGKPQDSFRRIGRGDWVKVCSDEPTPAGTKFDPTTFLPLSGDLVLVGGGDTTTNTVGYWRIFNTASYSWVGDWITETVAGVVSGCLRLSNGAIMGLERATGKYYLFSEEDFLIGKSTILKSGLINKDPASYLDYYNSIGVAVNYNGQPHVLMAPRHRTTWQPQQYSLYPESLFLNGGNLDINDRVKFWTGPADVTSMVFHNGDLYIATRNVIRAGIFGSTDQQGALFKLVGWNGGGADGSALPLVYLKPLSSQQGGVIIIKSDDLVLCLDGGSFLNGVHVSDLSTVTRTIRYEFEVKVDKCNVYADGHLQVTIPINPVMIKEYYLGTPVLVANYIRSSATYANVVIGIDRPTPVELQALLAQKETPLATEYDLPITNPLFANGVTGWTASVGTPTAIVRSTPEHSMGLPTLGWSAAAGKVYQDIVLPVAASDVSDRVMITYDQTNAPYSTGDVSIQLLAANGTVLKSTSDLTGYASEKITTLGNQAPYRPGELNRALAIKVDPGVSKIRITLAAARTLGSGVIGCFSNVKAKYYKY